MQAVNSTTLQQQAHSVQERVSWQREPAPAPSKTAKRTETFSLPEDVVTLSSQRSSSTNAPTGKKPSEPVNSAETKALRESFSVYA